jgi:GT2 family glycosyltransferase
MSTGNTGDFVGPIEGLENSFSIIIPTYRRPKQLAACLESVAQLQYPREAFEVLVVDDGSQMPLDDAVRAFRDKINVTLLTQKHGGPAAARNTGAQRAKGKFLAFTDDDCAPSPNWLQALAKRVATSPDCLIGGHTVNALVDNPYSAASQMLLDYLYSYFNTSRGAGSFLASGNICMPADRFRAIGGFDANFPNPAAEDREFCDRWVHSGYRLTYAPEAIVHHAHSLTLLTFWRQHFRYARGAVLLQQLQFARKRGRVGIRPLSFYANLLRYPFSQAPSGQALRASLLLAVSQAATIAGFSWEKIVSHRRLGRQISS